MNLCQALFSVRGRDGSPINPNHFCLLCGVLCSYLRFFYASLRDICSKQIASVHFISFYYLILHHPMAHHPMAHSVLYHPMAHPSGTQKSYRMCGIGTPMYRSTYRSMPVYLILIMLPFLLTGCFMKSVHPLVDSESSIRVDGLTGTWENESQLWMIADSSHTPERLAELMLMLGWDPEGEVTDSDTVDLLTFEEEFGLDELENGYLIIHQDKEEDSIAIFEGAVTELNGVLFLDLYLVWDGRMWDERLLATGSFANLHRVPVHTFSKLEIAKESSDAGEDMLHISIMSSSWLEEGLEDGSLQLQHEKTADSVLITASTGELQRFVHDYAMEEEAFEDPISLVRSND